MHGGHIPVPKHDQSVYLFNLSKHTPEHMYPSVISQDQNNIAHELHYKIYSKLHTIHTHATCGYKTLNSYSY